MTIVTRYRLSRDRMAECYCEIEDAPNGGYVSYSDYDALAARLADAERLLLDARKYLKDWRVGFMPASETDGCTARIDVFLRPADSASAQENESHG